MPALQALLILELLRRQEPLRWLPLRWRCLLNLWPLPPSTGILIQHHDRATQCEEGIGADYDVYDDDLIVVIHALVLT